MAKGFDKEIVEVAVAIQGNVAGIIGMVGKDAIDKDTRQQLIEQAAEAFIIPNVSLKSNDSSGSVILLDNENVERVKKHAAKVVDQVVSEVNKAFTGVNMDIPSDVATALTSTSISKAASNKTSLVDKAKESISGPSAMSLVNDTMKFCAAVNNGQKKLAEEMDKKLSQSGASKAQLR